jgi:hypothetical protein
MDAPTWPAGFDQVGPAPVGLGALAGMREAAIEKDVIVSSLLRASPKVCRIWAQLSLWQWWPRRLDRSPCLLPVKTRHQRPSEMEGVLRYGIRPP